MEMERVEVMSGIKHTLCWKYDKSIYASLPFPSHLENFADCSDI